MENLWGILIGVFVAIVAFVFGKHTGKRNDGQSAYQRTADAIDRADKLVDVSASVVDESGRKLDDVQQSVSELHGSIESDIERVGDSKERLKDGIDIVTAGIGRSQRIQDIAEELQKRIDSRNVEGYNNRS